MNIKILNTELKKQYKPWSRVESQPLPDGTYMIPERCLNDPALNGVLTDIADIYERDSEVLDLPEMGQPCTKGIVYKRPTTELEELSPLVICQQDHTRTEHDVTTIPALFTFFRTNSDDLEWIPNEKVETGWRRMYKIVQYEVIQSHMTVEGQTPDLTPALWNVVSTSSEWTIGVAYTIGDVVTYQGSEYECRQSHTSQAGWTPPAVLSLWLPL